MTTADKGQDERRGDYRDDGGTRDETFTSYLFHCVRMSASPPVSNLIPQRRELMCREGQVCLRSGEERDGCRRHAVPVTYADFRFAPQHPLVSRPALLLDFAGLPAGFGHREHHHFVRSSRVASDHNRGYESRG